MAVTLPSPAEAVRDIAGSTLPRNATEGRELWDLLYYFFARLTYTSHEHYTEHYATTCQYMLIHANTYV